MSSEESCRSAETLAVAQKDSISEGGSPQINARELTETGAMEKDWSCWRWLRSA